MRDKLISSEARWCAERAACWSPGDRAKAADMGRTYGVHAR